MERRESKQEKFERVLKKAFNRGEKAGNNVRLLTRVAYEAHKDNPKELKAYLGQKSSYKKQLVSGMASSVYAMATGDFEPIASERYGGLGIMVSETPEGLKGERSQFHFAKGYEGSFKGAVGEGKSFMGVEGYDNSFKNVRGYEASFTWAKGNDNSFKNAWGRDEAFLAAEGNDNSFKNSVANEPGTFEDVVVNDNSFEGLRRLNGRAREWALVA